MGFIDKCGGDYSRVNEKLMQEVRKLIGKPTNADRIRAMNDEELAEYIIHSGFCPSGSKREPCMHPDSDIECSECIRKWLQAEVILK